ncbi:CLUMA_CG016733, isoform A [Clunio marinus]|uniref:CLUMA_CG016733, isoform A n=1 Tax=Clunio marinus TaxID=568069 RepID=A0A1J1IUD3_9DIPT|nr:CLUMA_CG016733, isoform A [Clunio marinus]
MSLIINSYFSSIQQHNAVETLFLRDQNVIEEDEKNKLSYSMSHYSQDISVCRQTYVSLDAYQR